MRNPAWPISSAFAPPGPKATSGPKTRVLNGAGEKLRPAVEKRLDDYGQPDRLDRGAYLGAVAKVECDPSDIGLVDSRRGRLDDGGEAELAGCSLGLVCGVRDPLGDERDAVGLEQRADLLGGSHESGGFRQRRIDDAAAGGAVHVELGRGSRSALEPVGAFAGEGERAGGRFRIGKRDDRRAGLGQHAGRALRADHHRHHGLLPFARLDGAPDRGGDLLRAGDHGGTKITISASTFGSARTCGTTAS